ncbi:MAG TPA: hypothetical protein PKE40_00975 [Arachnia sp.]|nr:hypothetical protein [Arachnia sp.]HMT84899.1 hypothetical protein [Arachnia sp.]
MIRRVLLLVLAGSLTLSLLGCGRDGESGEPLSSGAAGTPSEAGTSAPASESPAPEGPADEAAGGIVITLLGPDGPIADTEDPVALVVEILEDGQPQEGLEVTFVVASGPGEYPDGFETATTDEQGVVVSQQLVVTGAGEIEVEVATATQAQRVRVEVVE